MSNSFGIPWAVALQALLSMRFPRQEYWSGLQFPPPRNLPNPGIEPESPALAGVFFTIEPLLLLSCFSRVQICATRDGSPTRLPRPWDSPGKNTGVGCHFLLQCMKVKSLSHVRPLATPWTAAYQAPLSMGFSWQEYWSGVPLPSPTESLGKPK